MPRILIGKGTYTPPAWFQRLVDDLAKELRENRESGQPVIREERFPRTGKLRVDVLWDEWRDVPHELRVQVIRAAYLSAEGESYVGDLALVTGLTFPEAYEAGMLPFQVAPSIREGDPVTLDQCREAMLAEGASELFPGGSLRLRFASWDEAEAAKRRLVARLPGSEPVWKIEPDADPTAPGM